MAIANGERKLGMTMTNSKKDRPGTSVRPMIHANSVPRLTEQIVTAAPTAIEFHNGRSESAEVYARSRARSENS
jgi:hypothetical protein